MRNSWHLWVIVALIASGGCSTTKSLEEGDVLYTGSRISIKKKEYGEDWKIKESNKKLTTVYWALWDTPNGALFGLPTFSFIPIRLWIYNAFYNGKEKGFSRFMRENFGQAPKTIELINPELKVEKGISIYENYGHFGTTGEYSLTYKKEGRKAYIRYYFNIPKAYKYRNIDFLGDTLNFNINRDFRELRNQSVLHPGDEFNLNKIRTERINIWTNLQNRGYHYLREDDIEIDADTSAGTRQIDMRVSVRDDLPAWTYSKQKVDSVSVIIDTIEQIGDDKYYYWTYGKIKRRVLDSVIKVREDELYSLDKTRRTVRNITEMGVFGAPRVNYSPADGDTLKLNAETTMQSIDMTSISVNLKGNYKNIGYLGPSAGIRFMQKNVFGGAENLVIDADAFYDFPLGVFKERISVSSGFSLRAQLSSPLIWRSLNIIKDEYSLPKQFLSLSMEYNDRKDYFNIIGWNATYGFTWKSRPKITHRIDAVSVTYSDLRNTTLRFDTLVMENPSLRMSLTDQFILGSGYNFRWDNSQTETKRLGLFFEGSAEMGGNALNLFSGIFSDKPKGEREIFNVNYSQFARFRTDFRAYWRMGLYSHLVFRSLAGVGLAYGNSSEMPYIKQFFIGGANSLRPINARTVGPGRYLELDEAEVNQVGDLKLEWNLEYRFRIFYRLYGAVFADAGNIWLLKEDPNRPLSGVRWNHILKDSWLTSGVGLRLDLNFLIVRADYGAIIYAPIFVDGSRWIWQNKLNLTGFVIGFGYPF